MFLSVIVATFNSGKTLKQTLDSIRYQTYRDFEVIVIDGMSTDNTLEIVKEYSDIVVKYISEKDTGIYNAFNKGIDLASGEYICFIGSDDCYCNYEVFDRISKELSENIELLSAPVYSVDESTLIQNFCVNDVDINMAKKGRMIPHQGMFVKTEVMNKYRFDEQYKIISDYVFLVRYLLDDGAIKFIDIPVVYYSEGGISSGSVGSNVWCLLLAEHIICAYQLGFRCNVVEIMNEIYNFRNLEKASFLLKMLLRCIRKCIGISDKYKIYFSNKKRHKCNLKICRWCSRGLHY